MHTHFLTPTHWSLLCIFIVPYNEGWKLFFLKKNDDRTSILTNCSLNSSFLRYVRDVSAQAKFSSNFSKNSTVEATRPTFINSVPRSSSNQLSLSELTDRYTNRRTKRQSSGREQLCQTTYQYITPQAALNSQGKLYYFRFKNGSTQKKFYILFSLYHFCFIWKRNKTDTIRTMDVCCESGRHNPTIGANGNVRVSVKKNATHPGLRCANRGVETWDGEIFLLLFISFHF